ncbi:hypothetical protein [Thermaurantiacus tibetensis]|nr:hypothetical protein [Thermaurantiacus tibetensis]
MRIGPAECLAHEAREPVEHVWCDLPVRAVAILRLEGADFFVED